MKIAILGHGVVGSGVYEVIEKNQDAISQRIGQPLEVSYILDQRSFPGLSYSHKVTNDFKKILDDPEISVVAEMMGGLHPAYDFSKEALQAGKSVVTSNKLVVAEKGAELLAVAREHNVSYLFEASVGGGIPLLHPMCNCFGANNIEEVAGILNGTTNYILTQMVKSGKSFDEALEMAQQNGYAEANPDADILGHDSARKISILANILLGKEVQPGQVYTEGITHITREDMAYAAVWGGAVKLVGAFRPCLDGRAEVMVAPCFVPEGNPLYAVEDVFNAVVIRGDMVDDVMLYGRGAGKLPTASAVVSDIMELALASEPIGPSWEETDENLVVPIAECHSVFFVRIKGGEGLTSAAEAVFGFVDELDAPGLAGERGFITEKMQEKVFVEKLQEFAASYPQYRVLSSLRVFH